MRRQIVARAKSASLRHDGKGVSTDLQVIVEGRTWYFDLNAILE